VMQFYSGPLMHFLSGVDTIKYIVNSDLLFRPGDWQMAERGKQIIAGFAAKLA